MSCLQGRTPLEGRIGLERVYSQRHGGQALGLGHRGEQLGVEAVAVRKDDVFAAG